MPPPPTTTPPAAPADALPTLPSLPPAGSPTTTTTDTDVPDADSGAVSVVPDADSGPDAGSAAVSSTPTAGATPTTPGARRRELPVGWILAAVAATIVGVSGFVVLGTGSDPVEPTDPPPAVEAADQRDPDAAPADAASPDPDGGGSGVAAIDAIDDARDVVGEIDANDGEEELLAELGLGPTGEPIEVPADGPAGHHFTWIDPSGQVLDVVVDTVSGDYAVDASDGISFRLVGDEFFGRQDPDGEWFALADDPFDSIPVIGLDGVPTVETILPPSVAAFATSDSTDGAVRTIVVDDAALAAADLEARNDWLRPWGLLDESGEAATDAVVRITTDPSGTGVVGASIDTPVLGGVAAFSVEEILSTPPSIDVPPLGG